MDYIAGDFHYPLPVGERGDGLGFILYEFGRFLDSRMVNVCTKQVIGAAHILQMQAFRQDPIGTLPMEEEELAALARCAYPEEWSHVRAPGGKPENGALQGWQACNVEGYADGVLRKRLFHPVILKVTMSAKRKKREATDASRRAVLSKLRKQVEALGYGKRVANNAELIEELDRALDGKRRTMATVREVIEKVSGNMGVGGAARLEEHHHAG